MTEFNNRDYETDQMRFENIRKMDYVEAWFDNHPEPENIDIHTFSLGNYKIEIYFAELVYNNFMIKITCNNARAAETLSKMLYQTTAQMGIEQILIFRKLFLFQDQRF